ncbi:P1 family peptidase [Rhabdothermincola salaria]|uniref:P1 family peptidase n=1 Tax=Rhabdothermincola salaria TaxID=2903142 RepID=UPI001E62E85B|nr:P1 family peptidase [Rhabdothermincola salaria]MCD9625509.1 P1 family peptidase [Rhabdothermincola salaria]
MLTDVEGVRVGHWTDEVARTGCTVVVLPEGTVASGEVRGGAPATREFALLDPARIVDRLDAVVLSGGSAFGLAAADGVMAALAEAGRGFATGAGPVPIVVGLSLFDLLEGDGSVRPGAGHGAEALASALAEQPPSPVLADTGLSVAALGRLGAGTGATVGKWRGRDHVRPGGIGAATVRLHDLVVSAMVAVNAFGDVEPEPGPSDHVPVALEDLPVDVATGAFGPAAGAGLAEEAAGFGGPGPSSGQNTTIGVVVTNATLDKAGCHLVAQGAHDGYARALFPPHTRVDGDAVVAAATGVVPADVDLVRLLAVRAVDAAIRAVGR